MIDELRVGAGFRPKDSDEIGRLVVGEDAACEGEGTYGGSRSVYAELYHASSGTWTGTRKLNAPRAYFVAEPLSNGRALVTAGINGDGVSYSSSKIYDVSTGAFTPTGLLAYARTFPAFARLNDGRVLVAGGSYYSGTANAMDLASAEIFDPATGAWSLTGPMHQTRSLRHSPGPLVAQTPRSRAAARSFR